MVRVFEEERRTRTQTEVLNLRAFCFVPTLGYISVETRRLSSGLRPGRWGLRGTGLVSTYLVCPENVLNAR
jgi:hypothetical protein